MDLAKIFEDLQGSYIFLPRSLRIFKDLHWSFANLTKIFEDLQGSSNFLPRSSRIFKDLWWPFTDLTQIFEDLQGSFADLAKILRILNFLAKIFEDFQRSLTILCRSNKTLRIFRILCRCEFEIPYKNNANIHFIPTCTFYMLLYSYHFWIFSLFSWTILNQFFTYFKSIILKQK